MMEAFKNFTITVFWFLMGTVALSLLLHVLVGFLKRILEIINELREK